MSYLSDVRPPWRRIGATVLVDGRSGFVVDAEASAALVAFDDAPGEFVVRNAREVVVTEFYPLAVASTDLRRCVKRDGHDVLDDAGRCARCGTTPGREPWGLLGGVA